MKDTAKREEVLSNNTFPTYMKKHFREWFRWVTSKGHQLKVEQIVLVRGTVKTTEWTVAAFQSVGKGRSINIQGSFVSAGSVGFELSKDTENDGSVEYRSGPDTARRSPSPSRSLTTVDSNFLQPVPLQPTHSRSSSVTSSEKPFNQCVFLPFYKIKYRLFLLPSIKAAAGYDELPDADNDDADTRIVVESEGQEDYDPDALVDFVRFSCITVMRA